jgi:hypothetical protein
VGKILNHIEPGVTAVYDRHSYDREKREALEAWAGRLDEIVKDGKATMGQAAPAVVDESGAEHTADATAI